MRFKKGSKVEVMSKWEVPLGSWCPAEIISGNGHTYNVRFITCSLDTNLAVGRVPRKLSGHARLLSSPQRAGFRGYRRCKGVMDSRMKLGNFSPQVPQSCIELEKYGGDDQLHLGRSTCLRELASRSGEKRPNDCLMIYCTSAGAKNKRRLVEKEGKCQPVLLEKVDAVASPYILGERYGVQHAIDEPNDDESIASSRGRSSSVRVRSLSSYIVGIICIWALNLEKEELMGNLRLELHISDDEHLIELKHLASTRTNVPFSLQENSVSSL
uniref:Agenet-like domain-containing protein n=1 Tax=Ananas comosus var. bracteatus TaxID=296719 RepID=A0A6V7NZE6_ANACO|nr:unnamed protein product [Ananas comosus var. bracteatus]